jgi:hypothetical protein
MNHFECVFLAAASDTIDQVYVNFGTQPNKDGPGTA